MIVGPVEQLLDHRMGGSLGGPRHPCGAAIKTHVPAHQVDEGVLVMVTDRIVLTVHFDGLGKPVEATVPKLSEQWQKPAVPCERGRVVIGRQACHVWLEDLPGAQHVVPRAIDDLPELTAGSDPVVLLPGPR